MNHELVGLAGLLLFCICAGALATRIFVRRREDAKIVNRLKQAFPESESIEGALPVRRQINKELQGESDRQLLRKMPGYEFTEKLIAQSGIYASVDELLLMALCLLLAPAAIAFLAGQQSELFILPGVLLAATPWPFLVYQKNRRCAKFNEQLPDAIDLMISILRSGHSLPQAVNSIAQDIPAPCGSEFAVVSQRISLGQTLPTALLYTVERVGSFEIDLIRRATAIQLEVGGSLADLLEKTNSTLRQRLKLKRQVVVLTAQSRLTAMIVGFMPFIIAAVFSFINPNYLGPLLSTNMGKILLTLALIAQVTGVLIMRKLSAFKV